MVVYYIQKEGKKMKRTSLFLNMTYNTIKEEITITPENLLRLLSDYRYCSLEAAENIEKAINHLTRKGL